MPGLSGAPEWFITDYPELFTEIVYLGANSSDPDSQCFWGIWQSGNLFTISQILQEDVEGTLKFNIVNPFVTYTGTDGASLSNTAYNGAYWPVDLPEWSLVEDNEVEFPPISILF